MIKETIVLFNAVIDLDRASNLKWSARQTRTGPCPPFRIDVSPSSALPRSSLSPPKRAISLDLDFATPYPHYPPIEITRKTGAFIYNSFHYVDG